MLFYCITSDYDELWTINNNATYNNMWFFTLYLEPLIGAYVAGVIA